MNQNPLIRSGEPAGPNNWVDQYLPYDGASPAPRKPLIDLNGLLAILFRQRWTILATIASTLLAALILTVLTVPIYQARASLQADPFSSTIVENDDLSSYTPSNQVGRFMETQIEIIESRKLATQVAALLNLDKRPAFANEDRVGARPDSLSDEEWRQSKLEKIGGSISRGVRAEGDFSSQIIEIFYADPDPVLAAELANGFAEIYAQSDTQRNVESNAYARDYLQEQIMAVRARLQEAEVAANDYARENQIVSTVAIAPDGVGGTALTVTGSNLANINATFASARAQRIAAEQKWRAIANVPAQQLPEVQTNPVIAGLNTQLAELQTQLTELQRRYEDNFPDVQETQARIASVRNQIATASGNVKAAIRNEYQIALRQENALKSELESISQSALGEQDRQVQFAMLEREAEALRAQLDILLNQFNTVSTAANVQTGRITKLDNALVPTAPITPNLIRNLLIGLAAGIAFAAALSVLREIFDDRLRSTEQIGDRLGLALIGHTPFTDVPAGGGDDASPYDSLMEAYASIRSTIDHSVPRDGCVIQFTSSKSGEGKSTTALIIAELFAHLGRDVLLIDADLRRPSIARLTGLKNVELGLTEVLLGHCKLDDAIVGLSRDNHSVLPVSASPANPTELLASRRFKELLAEVRNQYSMVIIDSPPVMGIADAPSIAAEVDACVFVAEANAVRISQAQSAIKRLQSVNANILGAILTKYRAATAGEGYGYGYDYYNYAKEEHS